MGFFKKIKEFFHGPDLVEEIRVIHSQETQTEPEAQGKQIFEPLTAELSKSYLAQILKSLRDENRIKRYINIDKFIDKWYDPNIDAPEGIITSGLITVDDDIKKLAGKWVLLGWKCKDELLDSWMRSIADGN